MENEKLKLYGVLNYFENTSGFELPVFMNNDGKMFIGTSDDNQTNFTEFNYLSEEDKKRVRSLDNIKNLKLDVEADTYTVGTKTIMAFNNGEDSIYITTIDKMLDFLIDFESNNKSLMDEVNDVRTDIWKRLVLTNKYYN